MSEKPVVFNYKNFEDALMQIENLKKENQNLEIHIRILEADLTAVAEQAAQNRPDGKWTPAEEEFPPEQTQVIVTDGNTVWIDELFPYDYEEDGELKEWQWDSGMSWIGTAWMPLPELPKWKKEWEK